MRLIESPDQLTSFLASLSQEPLLAVDTEAASFHRYHDRIYLLQISSRSETAVVDPLAVGSLAPLGGIMGNRKIEIVFHDADYDIRLLGGEYGLRPANLFDTRVAAQLLNEPGVGLAALLEKYFGVKLDKRFQRADWSARPLSPEMLDYAASDTRHLPELRDILRRRLEETGRLEWAQEEFELVGQNRGMAGESEERGFLRLKGSRSLKGRELAVLRELYQWREGVAQRADKATFRILNNEPLLLMAKNPPADLMGLRAVPGISADQADRRGREILAAVRRAMDLPESELPRIERPARRNPDPAYEARLDRLKTGRNRLAARLDLAPGVLCPNGTLEVIARVNPTDLGQLAAIPELRRWQVREFGEELLEAAKGALVS